MDRVVLVLQARLNSTRVPGKALEQLGPYSLISHCLRRLLAADAGRVVLATTAGYEDDLLEFEAARLGVETFRGSTQDVLARIMSVAAKTRADYVIRALGSNPALDPGSATRVLAALKAARGDHAIENGLPLGTTLEAVTADALRRCAERAWAVADREQVTSFMRRPGSGFRCVVTSAPGVLCRPDLNFSVETRNDLLYMRTLLRDAAWGSDAPPPLQRIIVAADVLARCREVA